MSKPPITSHTVKMDSMRFRFGLHLIIKTIFLYYIHILRYIINVVLLESSDNSLFYGDQYIDYHYMAWHIHKRRLWLIGFPGVFSSEMIIPFIFWTWYRSGDKIIVYTVTSYSVRPYSPPRICFPQVKQEILFWDASYARLFPGERDMNVRSPTTWKIGRKH